MIIAGIGKVQTNSVRFNHNDNIAFFRLQDKDNAFLVETTGLEQFRLMQTLTPGKPVIVIGAAEDNGRIVRARFVLPVETIGATERRLMSQLTNQIIESHLS